MLAKYDSFVVTDNEVLNAILTEKALLCLQKDIRFSCSAGSADPGFIDALDLHTLLGNILDNAIESAERLKDREKMVVSFSLEEKAGCLYFCTQNYYEGDFVMKDGLLQTTKEDSGRHGIGLSSIRRLAEKYGGDLRLSADGGIFRLQLIIPIAAKASEK